jgi:hypothetical protein
MTGNAKRRRAKSAKAPKATAARRGDKRRKETGIDEGFAPLFVGLEDKIAGHMHYKPPRWKGEHEIMKVSDLVQRITSDLDELCARAYPTATAYYGLVKQRLPAEESRHAANALVFLTQRAATYLENLFFNQRELIKQIARTRDLWPVNLALRWETVEGKPTPEVRRLMFARGYLTDLELNLQCNFPSSHESGAKPVSPFRVATEELYSRMLLIKRDYYVWFPKLTRWGKRLLALKVPMRKSNAADWWKVVKVYLYERWDKAQQEFEPLLKHLGFKYPLERNDKMPYESMFKKRVIDNDLKMPLFPWLSLICRKLPRVSYK